MITHISISNFAIIENTEIDFDEGLNIITGETGSGKSIVIEAISLALGSRADSSLVRHGATKAIVQLAGDLDGEEIIITREVSSTGKNLCKLNGQLVTLAQLSDTCRRLADIHGQYDNQSLLNVDNHIKLVDSFNDGIISIKANFSTVYEEYESIHNQLSKLLANEADNLKKQDFYTYQKNEIEKANITSGEDDALSQQIKLLQNSEKIYDSLETAYSNISSGSQPALTLLGQGMNNLNEISQYSDEIRTYSEELADIYYRLEDLSYSIRDMKEKVTFSPDELDRAISRLDLLDSLKKKYGPSLDDVLSYYDNISKELNSIENFDELKTELTIKEKEAYASLESQADLLSEARKTAALKLEKLIENELHDLNFSSASLKISFERSKVIGPDGYDLVEILISTNQGEPVKPLIKVASGGEISRIMLAIKNITGTYDNINTMFFDEIDAGISGITASVVGRKLREISKSHQIICITHLPQIAVCADTNFRIFKQTADERTFTTVDKLDKEDTVMEIARLLGGDNITPITIESAKELLESAKLHK